MTGTALVVGATSELGAGIGVTLVEAGHEPVLRGQDEDRLRAAARHSAALLSPRLCATAAWGSASRRRGSSTPGCRSYPPHGGIVAP